MARVSDEVRQELMFLQWDGRKCVIARQLDRKLYVKVNEVLTNCGGKWVRKAKCHEFDSDDSQDAVAEVIASGEYVDRKKELQFFQTPETLAAEMARHIHPGETVLEPSAGRGRLVSAALAAGGVVTCLDIDGDNTAALHALAAGHGNKVEVLEPCDFLQWSTNEEFDHVLMNPPFARRADMRHTRHAWRFLKPGGMLKSILSAGVLYRQDLETIEFRRWVQQSGGIVEPLPEKAFRESGTDVRTVWLCMQK